VIFVSPAKIVHIEDKYTAVRQLIELGKQKKYLLYDEIYEILPDEVVGLPDEVDEIYRRFDELAIAVVDRPERYVNRDEIESTPPADFEKKEAEEMLDLSVDDHEKTSGCICARWARCRFWIARARSRSPSASSRASG
jgi:hypothetical protein